MKERKTSFQQLDFTLLFLLFVLMCISLLAVYSGSQPLTERWGLDPLYFARRQLIWFGIGSILMLATMSVDYELLKKLSIPFYAIGMVLLLLVEFVGIEEKGAQRWLGIENVFQFQPSEFVKVIVIISLAHLLYIIARKPREKSFKSDMIVVAKILAVGLPPFFLILIQPDLGTALVIGAVLFSMIIMSGVTYRMISSLVGLVIATLGLLVWLHNHHFDLFKKIIKEHQLSRIYAWLEPEASIGAEGYQLYQAIQGIGAGRLYGSGFTDGVKSQSGLIPELHTDFIFTVIGEEFGFLGATILIVVYFLLLYRLVIIAFNCNNTFGTYLVAGVVGLFVFQVFQNIGMTIGLMPITGIALPFISYGGSNLMSSMIAIGIALNVNIRTKHYMFGEED